jgi:hypothetical protein
VRHNEVGHIEVLGLSVGLSVLEEIQYEAARLLRPAALGRVVTLHTQQR